jgi:asparagine synthase (glutamine-hydrolysing)
MPGIVGLITKMPREWAEPQLRRMVQSIHHESFYGTGTWVDESLGIYVGWAIPKGSFSDGMPICNERGDVVLVFSGEEYPDPGIAPQLKLKGHTLNPTGPSYLVHLYEEDSSFPAALNGRFHGLLVDQKQKTATLFNDRYGMHRLYYHESKEAFYFAAEAKAILQVRPELRRVNARGLGEFIACGCVLENRTLFEGIHVLPPASAWSFQNGSIKQKENYFEPQQWEQQELLDPESYYQQLREVFTRNLPRYFNGQQNIGMSLTGGLDTRMILAWHKSAPDALPCYSFAGMFRDCQDVRIARKVASACHQSHQIIPVGKEFLANFPYFAERTVYLTDGCTDVSHAPDLFANQRAAKIAPVRMTGNYGGEVLRRVRAFKPIQPAAGLFCREMLDSTNMAAQTYKGLLQSHPLSFAVFKQAPWHHYGLLALEQTQVVLRSPYLDNDFVQTVFRAPASALVNNDICLRLIADGDAGLRRMRTDRGLGGSRGKFTRTLTREFLEFTFKAEYAYDYGMPQSLARVDHIFSRLHFERLFLGRHKFYHFRVWYRDQLSRYIREMLLDSRSLSRPYLERKSLETMVNGHLKGNRNYTTEIHKLLTLELWHRLFLDSSAS